MAGYIFIGCIVLLIILLFIRETKNNRKKLKSEQGDTGMSNAVTLTSNGYYAMYTKKLARHKKDICIQPVHGATWLYSSKDPGDGMENVVLATNDPELLRTHPELGNNEIFNDYIKTL